MENRFIDSDMKVIKQEQCKKCVYRRDNSDGTCVMYPDSKPYSILTNAEQCKKHKRK